MSHEFPPETAHPGRLPSHHGHSDHQSSDQQFASAFTHAAIGMALVATQGRFLRVNRSLCRMLGYMESELLSMRFQDLTHADDLDEDLSHLQRLLNGEVETYQMEKRYYHKDGNLRWVHLSVSLVQDETGRPLHLISQIQDITKRKQAVEERVQLAERLTNTLESVTEAFFTVDRHWRFTYVNPEAARMLEHPSDELLERFRWTDLPRATQSPFQAEYERALKEGTPIQFEEYYPPYGWQKVRLYPSPQGLAVYYRDINAERRARESLQISEERFRLLSDATNDVVWDWDLVTGHLWWDDGFSDVIGATPDQVEPTIEFWSARVHPDDREGTLAHLHAVQEDPDRVWSREYRLRRMDGTYAHVHERGNVIRDNAGKAIRMVGGLTDLTERIRSEERIAEQAALLDEASDAIIVRNLDNTVRFWNLGAEKIYGWRSDEVVGRSETSILYKAPGCIDDAMNAVFKHGIWSGELEQIRKDGAPVRIFGRWSLLRDPQGNPKSILAINTDITEHKNLEQQFLRAQRMESLGTLAGGIAHDLNNVFAPILMTTSALKRQETDADQLEDIIAIEMSAQRGADMVRQVLTFARGADGERKTLHLQPLLRDVASLIQETFPKAIAVRTKCPADLWALSGDGTQLYQVLLNACVNARDAMTGGGVLCIHAENIVLDEKHAERYLEASPGPYVHLQITDDGTGISPDIQERVFEPFFTTKAIGKGTGLALYLHGNRKGARRISGFEQRSGRGYDPQYIPPRRASIRGRSGPATGLNIPERQGRNDTARR